MQARVFNELRRQLLRGEWQPNTPLRPVQIADTLGASTSPVRDALIRLTERGLAVSTRQYGFSVASIDPAASTIYCSCLASFYRDSISRILPSGRIATVAQELRSGLANAYHPLASDVFVSLLGLYRTTLLLPPYQRVAEHLDDLIGLHSALSVGSDAFYRARLTELTIFASTLAGIETTQVLRAVSVYYRRLARQLRRDMLPLTGRPPRP